MCFDIVWCLEVAIEVTVLKRGNDLKHVRIQSSVVSGCVPEDHVPSALLMLLAKE